MSPFVVASVLAAAAVVALAYVSRGRPYAGFSGVLLTVQVLVTAGIQSAFDGFEPVLWLLQASVFLHFAALTRPRLRGLPYRALISMPSHFFAAGTLLAFPWAIAGAFGLPLYGVFLPYLLAGIGVFQSLRAPQEVVDIDLDGVDAGELARHGGLRRHRVGRAGSPPEGARSLRVVQITDPHLGPFMSEERLRRICQRAVEAEPDLVLLTGDFLTMEGQGSGDEVLARALSPLKQLEGRVFACHGNHDLECPELVARGLSAVGARLLVDDAELVQTRHGPLQIVGLDHHWRRRDTVYADVLARHPREPGVPRFVMLHDPGGFKALAPGEADLVFSGHTHGGHLGLLSLGSQFTLVGALFKLPDHGLWARGPDRLYVHRANGHYGFPLRIGVPAEDSVLRVHWTGVPRA